MKPERNRARSRSGEAPLSARAGRDRSCSRPARSRIGAFTLIAGASLLIGAAEAPAALALPGAMGSPWWENYTVRQSYLCPGRGAVVVERNDSQASLLSGGFRSTLFRDGGSGGELSFRNDDVRLTLQGDVLTLEQATRQITCLRTQEA